MNMQERLAEYANFFWIGILRHGLAAHMRDYDVLFEALWSSEERGDERGTYMLSFTHCPEVNISTKVDDDSWRRSWDDAFIDDDDWAAAGEPEGFMWFARWSLCDPGLTYLEDSPRAAEWTKRLGHPMHEVSIETEAFDLRIIFHDFSVKKRDDTVRILDKVIFPL